MVDPMMRKARYWLKLQQIAHIKRMCHTQMENACVTRTWKTHVITYKWETQASTHPWKTHVSIDL